METHGLIFKTQNSLQFRGPVQ